MSLNIEKLQNVLYAVAGKLQFESETDQTNLVDAIDAIVDPEEVVTESVAVNPVAEPVAVNPDSSKVITDGVTAISVNPAETPPAA
jgi:hypothetical protein